MVHGFMDAELPTAVLCRIVVGAEEKPWHTAAVAARQMDSDSFMIAFCLSVVYRCV